MSSSSSNSSCSSCERLIKVKVVVGLQAIFAILKVREVASSVRANLVKRGRDEGEDFRYAFAASTGQTVLQSFSDCWGCRLAGKDEEVMRVRVIRRLYRLFSQP